MKSKAEFQGKKTWENYYWYYYKWHYLIIGMIVIAIIICTAQCAAKENPDYYVLFSADRYITDNALTEVTTEMEKHSEDLNGDGKVTVQAINCTYASNDENPALKNSARQQAMLQLQSKETVIWILDDEATELYYGSDNIDIFGKSDIFSENNNHSLPVSSTCLYEILKENGLEEKLQIFCRKEQDSDSPSKKTEAIVSEMIKDKK